MKLEERTFGTPCIYIFLTNLLKFFVKYIDIFVLFFCLLLLRLAVRNSLPFHDFLQVIIVLNQVYNWAIRHHSKVCRCRLADILYFGKNTEHWVAYGCLEHSCILPLNSPFICSSKISHGCSTRYALS